MAHENDLLLFVKTIPIIMLLSLIHIDNNTIPLLDIIPTLRAWIESSFMIFAFNDRILLAI